jgi:anti-sigma-K factor RskA
MDIKKYISSGIIELYVMGLCSTEEEKELEELRRQNPLLHDAILQYEMEMENKMQQNITLPPGEVDEKILSRLQSLNDTVTAVGTTNISPVKKISAVKPWWKIAAAAALVLFIVSSYFNYSLIKKNKQLEVLAKNSSTETLPLSDYAVITNPAITPVAMYGVGTHAICRCTMFWDKKTGKAYIMIHHLPRSSSAKDYQLWAEVDGKMISVGIINDDIRGRFIEVANVPAGSIAFSVTLEQKGGTNSPTLAETYLAGKI